MLKTLSDNKDILTREFLINCIHNIFIPKSISNYISFYSNAKYPYYKMSNFNHIKSGIIFNGLKFYSTEHAFQAQKYIQSDRYRFSVDGDLCTWDGFKLVNNKDINFWKKKDNIGIIAKMATNIKIGKKLGLTIDPNFKSTIDLWIDILLLKYNKTEYKNILLNTGDFYLLEFDKGSRLKGSKWGGIIDDKILYGNNIMGTYHMIIRKLIRDKLKEPRFQ